MSFWKKFAEGLSEPIIFEKRIELTGEHADKYIEGMIGKQIPNKPASQLSEKKVKVIEVAK